MSMMEIVKLIGGDVLPDDQKLILEIARVIRLGFLQQNAFHKDDTCVSLEKQFKMMDIIILIYERALKLIKKGIPISEIKKTNILQEYNELKNNVKNDEIYKIDDFEIKVKNTLKKLEEEYKEHI